MKKTVKLSLAAVAALAVSMAAVACDGAEEEQQPEVTTYAVTYALNGGEGTLPTQSPLVAGATFVVASGEGLSKDGHSFAGWNDGAADYAAGDTYTMPAHDVTLTAKWTVVGGGDVPVTYTVTYDLNGGEGTAPTQSALEAGKTFTVATGEGLSKLGHTFGGWSDGAADYAAGATYTMPAHDVTLTAKWATLYALSYNVGEGATGAAPEGASYVAGTNVTLAQPTGLSKPGHTFGGWSDGEHTYQAGESYTMPAKPVELTAVWTENEQPPAATYSVTYALEVGSGTLPTQDALAAGETFNVAAGTGLARNGYVFAGWNDGTNDYAAGASYSMPAHNVTLTAKWSPEPGIALPDEAFDYTGDCTLPITSFLGAKIGGENIVGIAVIDESKDLYYKIKGATGWVKSPVKYSDANGAHKPDKYGDTAHYYEAKIGEVNYYALVKSDFSELTLCNTDDEILEGGVFTATQQPVTMVTVTFDLNWNGANAPQNPASQTVNSGSHITQPDTPSRTGYTFDGWHVGTANGEKVDFATYTVTEDVTLVAKWIPVNANPTATFTKPEGATGEDPDPIEMNSTTKFPANTYTKEGWTFQGWRDAARIDDPEDPNYNEYSAGKVYTANTPMTANVNKEYIAVFSKTYTDAYNNSYTVRDDGYVSDGSTNPVAYNILHDNIIEIPDWLYTWKLNADNTISYYDGYDTLTQPKTADNKTLAFDGYGKVTLDGYEGTYSADWYGTITIAFTGATVQGSIVLTETNDSYTITANATITINGTSYVFGNGGSSEPDVPDEIPARLYGTYTGSDDSHSYSVVVSAEGVTLSIDGAEAVAATGVEYKLESSLSGSFDCLTFTVGEVPYEINNNDVSVDKATEVVLWINVNESSADSNVTLTRSGGSGGGGGGEVDPPADPVTIPSAYVGTYKGAQNSTNYEVVISADSISVKIGDADAVVAEVKSADSYYGFTLLLDGSEWCIVQYGYGDTVDKISMYPSNNTNADVTLSRVGGSGEIDPPATVTIPEAFKGNYEGTKDSVKYVVNITADSISVKIGDAEAVVAELTAYDESDGFTLKLGQDEWYLVSISSGSVVDTICIYPASDSSAVVSLKLQYDYDRVNLSDLDGKVFDAGKTFLSTTSFGTTTNYTAARLDYVSSGNYYKLVLIADTSKTSGRTNSQDSNDTATSGTEFIWNNGAITFGFVKVGDKYKLIITSIKISSTERLESPIELTEV